MKEKTDQDFKILKFLHGGKYRVLILELLKVIPNNLRTPKKIRENLLKSRDIDLSASQLANILKPMVELGMVEKYPKGRGPSPIYSITEIGLYCLEVYKSHRLN